MPDSQAPQLRIAIAEWTLVEQPSKENEWTLGQRLEAVKKAGFDAYACPGNVEGLKDALAQHDLRHTGMFYLSNAEDAPAGIAACREVGDGPVNVQLARHDTPVEDAIGMIRGIMLEGERQGVAVHIEAHRDRCTETPEKVAAILEGYKEQFGTYPRMNYDFSHPAVVKHLYPPHYVDRLIDYPEVFQASRVWHARPFNGHHCQIPVTDGRGNFSPEYEGCRPFFREAIALWLKAAEPGAEFWVLPELGPVNSGYGLSCFPNIWEDAIVLGNDLRTIWNEELAKR